jgi:hypothetical protein
MRAAPGGRCTLEIPAWRHGCHTSNNEPLRGVLPIPVRPDCASTRRRPAWSTSLSSVEGRFATGFGIAGRVPQHQENRQMIVGLPSAADGSYWKASSKRSASAFYWASEGNLPSVLAQESRVAIRPRHRRLDAAEPDAVGQRLGYWLGLAVATLTNSWEPADVHHLHVSSLGAGVNGAFCASSDTEKPTTGPTR